MTHELDLAADIVGVRDIIDRVEEIEDAAGDTADPEWKAANPDDAEELAKLWDILNNLAGYGGDEQFRGDWYPGTLIRDSYFEDYCRDMLEDCGYIPRDLPEWIELDYEATALNMRVDYASIDIDDVTYWYR
jgi:hypothetical protein